jgi:ferritin-like protein
MAGLSRLVRQICLLREQGDTAGAARLQEKDLATAVADMRQAHGAAALPDDALAALYAREAQRVSEALLTAELMVARLAELWSPLPAVMREASAPPASSPARSLPAIPAGPPAITDLLDAMLAAERTSTRLAPALNR